MDIWNNTSTAKLGGTVTQPPRADLHARLQQIFDALKRECYQRLERLPLRTGDINKQTYKLWTYNFIISKEDDLYCDRTVDVLGGCWNDTPAGSIAATHCPGLPGFNTKDYANKECTINGTWFVNRTTGKEWANYSACFVHNKDEDHKKVIYIFVGGFSLSLLMLILSLFIFFRYRQLRCDRITIHKNLFISYVFSGLSWLLYYLLVALDGNIQLENPVWCQMLHLVTAYFTLCNFQWMFCEGLYLHTVIVYAFNTAKTIIISCHVIGWFLPFILTVIYAGIRGWMQLETIDCWIHASSLQWIMYGPIVLSIAVNVIFLINIIRLLVGKLKQIPASSKIRKATRATLILVPLLGLQYLPFSIRPEKGSPLEEIYHIAVALVVSLQGAFVSLIYCFCNSEVISLMRRKWKQHRLMKGINTWSLGRGASTHYFRTGSSSNSGRSSFSCSMSKKNESDRKILRLENGNK